MSYRGDPANIGIPELESVRRLREGAVRLPDGSGFFVGTVGKKKQKRESAEGGPGSGPRGGGKSKARKAAVDRHISLRQRWYKIHNHPAASPDVDAVNHSLNKAAKALQTGDYSAAKSHHDRADRILSSEEKDLKIGKKESREGGQGSGPRKGGGNPKPPTNIGRRGKVKVGGKQKSRHGVMDLDPAEFGAEPERERPGHSDMDIDPADM
jgi:hypothetical protein